MSIIQKTSGLLLVLFFMATGLYAQEQKVKNEIMAHGEIIRQAFADEDLDKIVSLHHPEVTKAIAYNNVQNGREEVIAGLKETLKNYRLEFVENTIENILVQDSLAIEQTRFAIRGTPKQEGEPFIFKGRTMVTYIRYAESPTGWATIREIIQPASE